MLATGLATIALGADGKAALCTEGDDDLIFTSKH